MNKLRFIIAVTLLAGLGACSKSDFAESYPDPSKINTSTVEKQFAGFLVTNREYVLPSYWNYFVVLRTSVNRYTQSVGWVNSNSQYVPGAASINDRWNNFYNLLSQYRNFELIYDKLSDADKTAYRIFKIAATIYLYDHTQRVVDLHGDIPFTNAGNLSGNGGDYGKSLPSYDQAPAIYTKMLDDLKGFATELNSLTVPAGILTGFKNQDFINNGDLSLWKAYCNSLRLRMLSRVSGVAAFTGRSTSESAEILGNPAQFPIVSANNRNIQIDVYNLSTPLNSSGFRSGLEDWDGNLAGKVMIDHLKANADPRLRAIFEPGVNAAGNYTGLDPMLTASAQTELVATGTLSIYNRSTLSRNQFFPGILMNAAEVSLIAAEYNLKNNNTAAAKTAYETAIRQSIEFYFGVRSLSNDNTSGALSPVTETEITDYLAKPAISWDAAATTADKLKLIAYQKWIHFNVVQPLDNWAEMRRLDGIPLSFEVDNSNVQKQPPYRWVYAGSELIYNAENYEAVRAADNLTTKIFWDQN
ncbi:SusD/RagB family nutrient-binding outer membrane lipoprotein [Flavihumibacter sp. CACIAM 22H1]|uniref:SusD/RagB family nutrient-binding outer membrane lipoprotein n=1 Tax=Flavihumibacter sp. CACIAM 22H1 TaxID=1812911 RepID=UPI0007A86490|nr:SusD/RagB family nutrient-binding outer membrane lipoprotein [Flavihumibacter sp. CACIAM 22H1]KYP14453.1 MAG: hypothetical protein A1D16_18040 [Flavihumibacter sp. CACIAM 22H1]